LPLVVGLDGGYVHSSQQTSHRDGWVEVITGKAMPTDGATTCFGFVQTHDTKPKRRLFEVLAAQGMQANQQITFLTDGGEDIRELPRLMNPQAEHLLDWLHRHHADHRHDQHGQEPPHTSSRPRVHALPAAGPRRRRRWAAGAPQVVPLARQRLPGPADHRGP